MNRKQLKQMILSVGISTSVLFGALAAVPHTAEAATSASATANNVINIADNYMGVPYKFGAKSGHTGAFDCSSFTQFAFNKNGISLPRTSKAQSQAGSFVSKNNLQKGDLVFFYSPIHHVGIYIGNGKFIHTYGKPGVTISNLNSGWWARHYTTARRVIH